MWPDMWKRMSDASKRKENQKWTIEKPKLDNARNLRGIYFIDPEDEEFKDIMKKARGKLTKVRNKNEVFAEARNEGILRH